VSTFILWDIDGTLIYNTPAAGGLYLDSIEHVTGARPTERVANPHGMTEGQLLAAILEVNGHDPAHITAVLARLDELSLAQPESGFTRDRCVGALEAIAAVSERGWVNALLTGNGPQRARYKVIAAGIDPAAFDWEHSYFGHESPTRHHLTADARADLDGHHAVIIGDTPKDGEAADTAGIPFIAVATGAYSVEQLRDSSALVVVENLSSGLQEVLGAIAQSIGTASALK
jgi:phosphoglycolate phosphatase